MAINALDQVQDCASVRIDTCQRLWVGDRTISRVLRDAPSLLQRAMPGRNFTLPVHPPACLGALWQTALHRPADDLTHHRCAQCPARRCLRARMSESFLQPIRADEFRHRSNLRTRVPHSTSLRRHCHCRRLYTDTNWPAPTPSSAPRHRQRVSTTTWVRAEMQTDLPRVCLAGTLPTEWTPLLGGPQRWANLALRGHQMLPLLLCDDDQRAWPAVANNKSKSSSAAPTFFSDRPLLERQVLAPTEERWGEPAAEAVAASIPSPTSQSGANLGGVRPL